MMISPETFYEERLKGKSAKEIITVIRGLKQEPTPSRTIRICGSNAYPYNFDRLLALFEMEE